MRLLVKTIIFCSFAFSQAALSDGGKLDVNNEQFDIGVTFGTLSVEDFPTEPILGINATFKASEDFFIQYNYFETKLGESSFEANDAFPVLGIGDSRKFSHFDLLLGYSLFQGEFFAAKSNTGAHLSALNLVAGIGDTHLGLEENFTVTLGFGYQIEFYRRVVLRFDYRNHSYETTIIDGQNKERANTTQMSMGLSWLL